MRDELCILTALIMLWAMSVTVSAQTCPGSAGCLDPAFGGGNLVRVPNAGDYAGPILRQADGKLLAVATGSHISEGQYVTRLNADGSVDTTFAGDGTLNVLWKLVKGRDTYYGNVAAIGLQNIGGSERILVAGFNPMLSGKKVLTKRLRVDRLMADGSADISWGVNGTLQLNLNGAASLVVQPWDQKIVIGTGSTNQLIRLTASGQLDSSFGSGGVAGSTYPNELHLDGQGRILAAGWVNTAPNQGGIILTPSVTRHHSNGSRDTSFGNNGTVLAGFNTSYGYPDVSTDAFGNVILSSSSGGSTNTNFAVARFTESGVPDTTFSGDGIATFDFGGNRDIAMGCAPQADGSIVLVGNSVALGSGDGGADPAVVRFDYWGNPDITFGNLGGIVFPHTPGGEAFGSVLIEFDPLCLCEKIYAAGGNSTTNELLVTRMMTE